MRKIVFVFLVIALVTMSCVLPFTKQSASTPTPAFSPTPSLTSAPTSTPTLPPTPTPVPAVRIENAEQALTLGDFEHARREFQDAQAASSDPEVQAVSAIGIAQSLYLAHNYSTAIDTLKAAITTYPQSSQLAKAYFLLAKSLEAQKIYDQAAEAYGKYLELRPGVLDAYMQELRGDAYMSAGNPAAAAQAYSAAIAAPQSGTTLWTELKLGKAYAASQDFASAVKIYLDVYNKSDNDYARAQANFLMGQAYLAMGMPEQAHARYMDSIASFPKAYDSYAGLVQLVNDNVEVNELSRGMVDYYAQQYGLAVDAFTRYIATANPDAAPYHYRALSFRAQNDSASAIADWDTIINNYQTDSLWPTAWEQKAYTLWAYLDKYDDAANVLLQYVQQAPESARAAEFLFDAARIYERNNELQLAATTWEELINKYPSSDYSYRGLFLSGVSYYRIPDYPKALTAFQRVLVLSNTPAEQSAAYLWIGKAQQAKGDPAAAQNAWNQAAQLDPTGYYSERAIDLVQGHAPFTLTSPVDYGYDLAQERTQADAWMRSTFSLPEGTDLNGLGDLAADPHWQRGAAFWDLGLLSQARDEFEALRQLVASDPLKTYRLMNELLRVGVYRSAILASRQVLNLANMDDAATLRAPAYFNHIRFGIYFKDQIFTSSQSENINPLLLLSVLRQESLFEGFAESGAGAVGLMQIMPATGHEIASGMGWPQEYNDDDLLRPMVSIPFGARYLARQRDYFNGNLYAALASYNGGPGNTIQWQGLAGDDPDLLLEVIRLDETRTYIMHIYENFNIYRLLYQRGL